MADELETRTMLTAYVVDTATDSAADADGSTDGLISLREAVIAATTNQAFGDAAAGTGNDRITFDDGVGTITLSSELLIDGGGGLTIDGGGDVTLDGADATRLINIDRSDSSATVVQNIRLQNGFANSPGGLIWKQDGSTLLVRSAELSDANASNGGAIASADGRTVIRNSTLEGNAAIVGDDSPGSGGAVIVGSGELISRGNTFRFNIAERAGGAIETVSGSIDSRGDSFIDNSTGSEPGNGGAVHVTGAAETRFGNALFQDNIATSEGGGVWNSATGRMIITGSSFSGNEANGDDADNGGGAIFNDGGRLFVADTDVSDSDALGESGSGGGLLSVDGSVTLNGVTFDGNEASRAGGGIEVIDGVLRLNDSDLTANSVGDDQTAGNPGNGGGLHVTGMSTITRIAGGTVSGNTAASEGGGLWNQAGSLMVVSGGTIIVGNDAFGDAADTGGGGIYNNGGDLTLNGVNIRENGATGAAGSGGGLFSTDGRVRILDSSIAANIASRAGGGIEIIDGSLNFAASTLGGDSAAEGNLAGILVDALDPEDDDDDFSDGNGLSGSPGNGGGLHVSGTARTRFADSTVSWNVAANEGGGLWNQAGASMSVVDGTIVSDNTAVGNERSVEVFTVELETLNAAFGSTASGTGTIFVDRSQAGEDGRSGSVTIRVMIDADGLEDLTEVTGGIHVAHIHGQFAGNAERPLAEQGDGPFFDGDGGAANGAPPVDSVTPSTEADGDLNVDETAMFGTEVDYLDFFEGRPKYGPVMLNLTSTQLDLTDGIDDGGETTYPPSGTPPLTYFFQELFGGRIDAAALFPNGTEFNLDTTYEFDLSDQDQRRQFANMSDLELREIVLHGLTIPTEISDAIDAATGAAPGSATAGVDQGDGTTFRRTAPVAAGEIVRNDDASMPSLGVGGGGIFNNGGTLVVSGAQVVANATGGGAGSGGGILSTDGAVIVQDAEISDNTASRAGGGIEIIDGTLIVTSSDLERNAAGGDDAAESSPGNGGGLHVSGVADVMFRDTFVNNNFAANEGGGLWNQTGSVMRVLAGSMVSNNDTDGEGGGLFNNGGSLSLDNSDVAFNTAAGDGGGIFVKADSLDLAMAFIFGNDAGGDGGGIFVADGATLDGEDSATFFSNDPDDVFRE